MQPDDIELVRDPKIGDYLNECQLKTCDNPEYKYLWLGTYRFDYSSTKFTGEDIDAFKIKYEESTAGYIQWYHDWSNNSVPSFSIYRAQTHRLGHRCYSAIKILRLYIYRARNQKDIPYGVHR